MKYHYLILIPCLLIFACGEGSKTNSPTQPAPAIEKKVTLKPIPIKPHWKELYGAKYHELEYVYQKINTIQNELEFAEAFHLFGKFANSIDSLLTEKWNAKEDIPALELLNRELDGLITQRNLYPKINTQFKTFRDFKYWQKIAKNTPASSDDRFVNLCLQLFPEDSIEYYHAYWFIQTGKLPNEGSSLLGRGKHYAALEAIETLWRENRLFEPELVQFKQDLISDITTADSYWESGAKALKELDDILNNKHFSILTKEDEVQLRTFRKIVENPKKHKLKMNLFNGNE